MSASLRYVSLDFLTLDFNLMSEIPQEYKYLDVSLVDTVVTATLRERLMIEGNQLGGFNPTVFCDELLDLGGRIAKQGDVRALIINFALVERFASTSLSAMLNLERCLRNAKCRLMICRISESIFEVFKITSLDQFFEIFPTEDEATQALE